jgi:DNA invertase Pin-like site-specific DNA recombinase
MKAWIFVAVSTDKQAETLDEQERFATDAAAANGWTITRTFRGVSSGAKGARKLLEQLLSELRATPKAERPKRVILTRLDRTGRGLALEALSVLAQIYALGVIVHTREDGDVEIRRASDAIRPILRILTGAMENEARSDKWKATHARRRREGLHVGTVPFGVVLDGPKGRAVAYEPEAAIVRSIFEKRAAGWGYTRIAKWAATVAPRKRMRDGSDRPLSWAASSVKSILTGPTIRAVVVDADLAAAADATSRGLYRVRAGRRYLWPLAGALTCSCGKKMEGKVGGYEPHRRRYYVCRYHTASKRYPGHRADDVEASFEGVLADLGAMHPDALHRPEEPAGRDDEGRVRALEREEAAVDARRRQAWTLHADGVISDGQLKERLGEVDAERSRVRFDLDQARAAVAAAQHSGATVKRVSLALASLATTWRKAPIDEQQAIARAVAEVVGGLYLFPSRRGVLVPGTHAALIPEADASRIIGASSGSVDSLAEYAARNTKRPATPGRDDEPSCAFRPGRAAPDGN